MSPSHRPRLPRRPRPQLPPEDSVDTTGTSPDGAAPASSGTPASGDAASAAGASAEPSGSERSAGVEAAASGTGEGAPRRVRVNDPTKVVVLSPEEQEGPTEEEYRRRLSRRHRSLGSSAGPADAAEDADSPEADGSAEEDSAAGVAGEPGRLRGVAGEGSELRGVREEGEEDEGADGPFAGSSAAGSTGSGSSGSGSSAAAGGTVTDLSQRRHREVRRRKAARRKRRRSRAARWGIGLAAGLVLLLALGWAVFLSPLLAVREISVQGADRTDPARIQEALAPLEGTPLTRISEQEVRDLIGEDLVIRDLTVEALPPHELQVTLHERMPVAVVKEGDQYVLVDGDGVAIGTAESPEAAGVPLVDGGLQAVAQDSFHDLVTVLQALPQSLLEQMQRAEAKDAADLRLIMEDGSTVRWGTADQSRLKARVLSELLKALEKEGLPAQTVDVSSPEHPVTS